MNTIRVRDEFRALLQLAGTELAVNGRLHHMGNRQSLHLVHFCDEAVTADLIQ